MIKAKDYEDQVKHSRLDAAMLALGFSWDGEAYTKKETKTVKNVTVAPKAKRVVRKYRPEWTPEFYARVKALGHGQSMDISAEVRSAGLTAKQAQGRIYAHFYSNGTQKTYRYTLTHFNGGEFTLNRI